MDWTEDYIRRCLSGIPKSEYRNRLQSELADHLALLVSDLETVGYGTEEARTEALRQMGDAKELNAGYWAEWLRQPERLRWDISRYALGILLAGVGFLGGAALLFFGDVMLALFGTIAGGVHPTPFLTFLHHMGGAILYAAAFVPNAVLLRKAFRRRRKRAVMVSGGLLLSWIVGKGSTVLYLFSVYGSEALAEGKEIVARSFVGSYDPLWFTSEYMLLSLLGCIALGWLFGRYPKSKLRDEAQAADIWRREGGEA